MTTRTILLSALLAACMPAMANDMEGAAPQIVHRSSEVILPANTPAHALVFAADGADHPILRDVRSVKGAPYSAEVITEKVQNLPDGNQIVNKTVSMSYRDSAGRTRHEIVDGKGEVRLITIRDGAGGHLMLHPKNKTATKLGAPREAARAAREAARARIAQLRKEGKLPAAAEHKGAEGEAIVIKRVERAHGEKQREIQENVRIRIKALEGLQGRAFGPLLSGAMADARWAAQATTRELGTRDFDGVKAEGKMRSYEIPAGAIGNRNPISVTQETWYSPELQVTVYSKHTDPRTGERTYRLSGLKRAEPAATLFAVPSDYTVKDLRSPRAGAEQK